MLMELQKKQLQQLSDWLTVTEERIQKMESQLLAEDLEALQKQLEEHKVCISSVTWSADWKVSLAEELSKGWGWD